MDDTEQQATGSAARIPRRRRRDRSCAKSGRSSRDDRHVASDGSASFQRDDLSIQWVMTAYLLRSRPHPAQRLAESPLRRDARLDRRARRLHGRLVSPGFSWSLGTLVLSASSGCAAADHAIGQAILRGSGPKRMGRVMSIVRHSDAAAGRCRSGDRGCWSTSQLALDLLINLPRRSARLLVALRLCPPRRPGVSVSTFADCTAAAGLALSVYGLARSARLAVSGLTTPSHWSPVRARRLFVRTR